jgi:hypothetical protein
VPLKGKNPRFEDTLSRMQTFHKKKQERMTEIKRGLNRKFMREQTASPKINTNYRTDGNFYSRMHEDDFRRSLRGDDDFSSERIRSLKPEIRECTFTPKINRKSTSLNRSVNDMFLWEHKRQMKVKILQHEKTDIDYDFKPTIKSGKKTQPRFLDSPKSVAKKEAEFVNEVLDQSALKKIRQKMIPTINEKSREIVQGRARNAYAQGTTSCPMPVKVRNSFLKSKFQNARNPDPLASPKNIELPTDSVENSAIKTPKPQSKTCCTPP